LAIALTPAQKGDGEGWSQAPPPCRGVTCHEWAAPARSWSPTREQFCYWKPVNTNRTSLMG